MGSFSYMLESCGQVYYVCLIISRDPQINSVEIWELDVDNTIWVEVKSLSNRAFFLGNGCCTWCWADSRVEGNSVFVMRDFGYTYDNILYKYSLEDRSFTPYLSCPPDILSPQRQAFWFIPQGRSLAAMPSPKASIGIHILNQSADIVRNERTSNMLKILPLDIIALISKYLYCFDYLDFRATCKTFHSVLPLDGCQWRRTYHPLFVSLINNEGLLKVTDSFRNESCYITIPKSPKSVFSIEYCKDGWLILCRGSLFLQFFNLFTRTCGDFPPHVDIIWNIMSIGFSTCIGSSDCVTVGMIDYPFSILYMCSGDKDWMSFEIEEEEEEKEENRFSPSTCTPVYCNGSFYFLDRKGLVGVFKLVREKATWEVCGRPETMDTIFHSIHLLECDGQLFSVFIGILGKSIQVFRFEDHNKVWVEVKSLGNHVFFISRTSCISRVAKEVGMGNRIYLPRLHNKHFIFYSLETRKYHVVGTKVSIDCFWSSEEPLECCWVRILDNFP